MTNSDLPGDLTGPDPIVAWLNKLKRAVGRRTLLPGLGYKTTRDNSGTSLLVIPGSGGTSEFSAPRYRFKSMLGDYLICRTWDGTTEGSTDVFIAKPFKLRNSIASASIDGSTVTYTYSLGTTYYTRTAHAGPDVEDQIILPRYLVNDIIHAIPATTGVLVATVEVGKLDLNVDGRVWARKIQ